MYASLVERNTSPVNRITRCRSMPAPRAPSVTVCIPLEGSQSDQAPSNAGPAA
eukprot:m.175797 g.175797  ORF g.175797 m.175797 type:complete len:53 (-) comp14892_c0_seq2:575-733(-)